MNPDRKQRKQNIEQMAKNPPTKESRDAKIINALEKRLKAVSKGTQSKRLTDADVERWKQDHNSSAYMAGIFDPFNQVDIRKPDLTFAPTGTWSTTTNINMSLNAGATSGATCGLAVNGLLDFAVRNLTAPATLATAAAWPQTSDSNDMAYAIANFSAMRCVSMGLRCLDYGKVAERGVLFYAGMIGIQMLGASYSLDDLASLPQFQLCDISEDGEIIMNWLPIDDGPVFKGTTNDDVFANNWWDPSTNAAYLADADLHLVMFAMVDGIAPFPDDKFRFQIVQHYETLPLDSELENDDVQVVLGGGESLAVAAGSFNGKHGVSIQDYIKTGKNAANVLNKANKWVDKGLALAMKAPGPIGALAQQVSSVKGVVQQFTTPFLKGIQSIGGLFSAKEREVFSLLRLYGVHISCHHPVIKQLSKISDPDQLIAAVKDFKSKAKPKDYAHFILDRRGRPLYQRPIDEPTQEQKWFVL